MVGLRLGISRQGIPTTMITGVRGYNIGISHSRVCSSDKKHWESWGSFSSSVIEWVAPTILWAMASLKIIVTGSRSPLSIIVVGCFGQIDEGNSGGWPPYYSKGSCLY